MIISSIIKILTFCFFADTYAGLPDMYMWPEFLLLQMIALMVGFIAVVINRKILSIDDSHLMQRIVVWWAIVDAVYSVVLILAGEIMPSEGFTGLFSVVIFLFAISVVFLVFVGAIAVATLPKSKIYKEETKP